MIKSMTGYGKSSVEVAGRKLTIEIKTLNSKQLDLNFRSPGFIRDKELEIRSLTTTFLERGKVDLTISSESNSESAPLSVDRELARKYHTELKQLSMELHEQAPADLLSIILRMPDVMQSTREEISAEDCAQVIEALKSALALVDEFRIREGQVLEDDMVKRVYSIIQFLDQVDPFEKGRIDEMREKMLRDFSKYTGDLSGKAPDQNRFEQELIYYFEKLDITEEKVRLLKHCQYFLETMSEPQSQGKKLGFVVQEMGREINTIGSKANHAEIQKLVVQMKDELEKIREQLGNIL